MRSMLLVLPFLLALVPFPGTCQEFRGGVLAGVTSTQLDGDLYSGFNKTGFTIGAFVQRPLDDRKALQMEIRYYEKGSREDDTKDGGTSFYLSKINYVEIPVLYLYRVKRFVFEGGVSAGVLVKSSEEDFNGEIPEENRVAFTRFELAGHAGFSYLFNPRWAADFRFSYSILPVRENFDQSIGTVGPGYMSGRYSFNNCLSVSLFYQFDRE